MFRSETAKRWQERLSRFDRSQMTVAQFCQSEGISQPSFYHWKKKLRQPLSDAEPRPAAVQFLPLRIPENSSPRIVQPSGQLDHAVARTTIELPGGIRIRVEVPTDRLPDQPWGDRT